MEDEAHGEAARPVFRFAPSPNGELHLGHAYSALFSAHEAQKCGGRFLLRIEDIDPVRSHAHYEALIYEDLSWLGLRWETPARRQSEHFPAYRAALDRLAALDLVYPCFASRRDIARTSGKALDPDGSPLYPGLWRDVPTRQTARRIASGEPYALRLNMKRALDIMTGPLFFTEEGEGPKGERGIIRAQPEIWGDVILSRKDTPTSYHLSCVVDDSIQKISHVTRGQDLFYATHLHRLLQGLLHLPTPPYKHHRLIRNSLGWKLSKSAGDNSLRTLRKAGIHAEDIREMLGFPLIPQTVSPRFS